ncbi:hypothetical protein, conserved [Trypanosoma brucei gambiense DAL972]|uniref:Uncharacterized protein n=1 Tax=Trypanosoma brucei gambiense (strain MHOM/CI/86/DAL972) TaxID=679716 RepID=D0A6U5_TRYB9|nr:hypothetical protein, conserved [Trypanosoma brucei gambiense DAL972]CBH17396.1 hypothetical protein, conserved [Trypanosoma brucei gambiense DAL972]|eukprot:XP_011779660.1 hypothetical protein, conserved [Trypanosoma brucei gambiense DAL972]
MSLSNQLPRCATPLFYQLAENSDQFESINDMVIILQQHFVRLFKTPDTPMGAQKSTASSIASKEEEKLLAVRAVHALHTVGAVRHGDFFRSELYHTNAAFFIQEMLGCLVGDRRNWYRQLQVESLRGCLAVVRAVGYGNTRLCLPGIVSACTKYLVRAHHGTDAADVRVAAVNLMRVALTVSLVQQQDNEGWLRETVDHLGRGMGRLLAPEELVGAEIGLPVMKAMLRLVVDLLALQSLNTLVSTQLVRELLVGYFVLENLVHLEGENTRDEMNCVPSSLLENEEVVSMLHGRLKALQKVELLHYSSSLLRCEGTRTIVFSEETQFQRVMGQCIRVAGTQMGMEEFCGVRGSASRICSIVDGFIECLAYNVHLVALGPLRLATFMDECEATLSDWDLYALHPPTIYVLTRLIVWQFKTPMWVVGTSADGAADGTAKRDLPVEDLILSGTFEHLWSVVAKPHLWNITEDEDLCTYKQLQHRRMVAATILRFLEITAQTLRGIPSGRSAKRRRALRRLNVLMLYLVLEKAVIAGIVHDVAMRVIDAFSEASNQSDTLLFFLESSDFIADEAARAVTEEELRISAANVLHGGVNFIRSRLFAVSRRDVIASNTKESRRWVQVIKGSDVAITASESIVSKVADFVTSSIKVASDGCRRATLQEDAAGARAAVILLTSCFELSALLNRSVPQLGFDEDRDTVTTAAHPRVQILQLAVLEAVQMLLAYCARNDGVSPYVVRAVACGLTVFLTTPKAAAWEHEDDTGDEGRLPCVFPWEVDVPPVLSRNHLRTVYRAYLVFLAILAEPVATITAPNAAKQRSAAERRVLEGVRPKPGVLAALDGLETLFTLSTEFLSQRMVEEVLPAVLTWYERGALSRIPTGTEEKLKLAVKKFVESVCDIEPSITQNLHEACAQLLPHTLFSTLLE